MYQFDDVKLRRFTFEDIPRKIEWINNPENNQYLHYDLPLEYEKTVAWYERTKDRTDRFDAVVEYNGEPVGLTGLLNIDYKNSKAEDYVITGNTAYKGKGIATKAGVLNALYCFETLGLNKLYAHIEIGNPVLWRDLKMGFHVEGYLRHDLRMGKRYVDRYVMGLFRQTLFLPGEVHWEDDPQNTGGVLTSRFPAFRSRMGWAA